MKYVWLLWGDSANDSWVEGVYVDKVKAEADLRISQEVQADKDHPYGGRGFIYWIQEKEVTT